MPTYECRIDLKIHDHCIKEETSSSSLALQPLVSLGLLDDSLPSVSVLCLLPTSCHSVSQGCLTVYIFYRDEVVSLMPQPPICRTRVSLLFSRIAFDLFSIMGGPTGNISYRR
jgi:hypothetical protein